MFDRDSVAFVANIVSIAAIGVSMLMLISGDKQNALYVLGLAILIKLNAMELKR